MMGWLRSRLTETRKANDYTDLVINQLHAAATGSGSVRQSAVYASCLHMLESAASSAELTGEHAATLQAKVGGIIKEMVHSGQSAYELVIGSSGRLELLNVNILTVYGSVAPETWSYKIERPGPRSTETTIRPQESVLNFRLRPSPRTPWKGSPAIQAGNTTATLLAKLEQQFTSEASLKPARVLSIGVSPEQRKDVVDSIAAGGIVAFPQSRMGNESKALSTGEVGGEYSEAGVDLFGQLSAVICTMLGVPSDLIQSGGSDNSSKESFRRFSLSTIIAACCRS